MSWAQCLCFSAACGSCRESMCCPAVLCPGKCDGRCAAVLQWSRVAPCCCGLTGNGNGQLSPCHLPFMLRLHADNDFTTEVTKGTEQRKAREASFPFNRRVPLISPDGRSRGLRRLPWKFVLSSLWSLSCPSHLFLRREP